MDILIIESGSGGEIINRNNDIVMVYGDENQPLLAMFGPANSWMNGLLLQGDAQFTATTETTLNTTPLTSAGLIAIESAMLNDLQYLEANGTQVQVAAKIVSPNRVDAEISINGQAFYLQWSPDSSFLKYGLIE